MRSYINYLLLVLIALIWGAQFFLIKKALTGFPPLTVATLRAFSGTVALSLLLFFSSFVVPRNKASYTLKSLTYIFCLGFFEATLPFICISWGQQHTNTSTAAILVSTIPIFTIVLVAFFVKHESLSLGKYLSVIVGFIGVLVLLLPDAMQSTVSHPLSLLAKLAILAGACSFSISLVMLRRVLGFGMVTLVRNVLLSSTIQLLPLMLIFNHPWNLQPNLTAVTAVITLGVVASGIVYILYVVLLKRAGAAFTSLNNYLVPLFGVIMGIIIVHEQINWNVYLAFVILVAALLVSEFKFFKKRR